MGSVSAERVLRVATQEKLAALALASAELPRHVLDYQRGPTAMLLIMFVNAQQLWLRAQLERNVLVEPAFVSTPYSIYLIILL